MARKDKLRDHYNSVLETKQLWIGTIKKVIDTTRNGNMLVHIPEITGSDETDDALFNCQWSSPFAGATELGANTDDADPTAAQTSYGMWMRPPDPGTQVIVGIVFKNAKKIPVIISCLFHSLRNSMVPGIPAGQTTNGLPDAVTEVNLNSDPSNFDMEYEYKGTKTVPKSSKRPQHPLADNLFHQGLADDFVRGQSTSGARREDISEVFGILTPGSRQDGNPKARNPGHQFVMDDNDNNNLIRLRTGQGMQILLNDTNDIIYIVNKKGTGYIEIDGEGNIDIFGKGSYNVRTMGDLNLRADQNVNIEAGQDINIKAANNSPHPLDEGRGLGGIVEEVDLAMADPQAGPLFVAALTKGTVNIEGYKDVNIKGQNLEFSAQPSPFLKLTGTQGKILLNSAGETKIKSQNIIGQADGRVVMGNPIPGKINLVTGPLGTLTATSTNTVVQGMAKLNLEGAMVDIAPEAFTPVLEFPELKVSDYIGTKFKPMTLFGFDIIPLPVPLPEQPGKQVQGKTLTRMIFPPGSPQGVPKWEGMINKGVKTILSRVPQPEPSTSKKDKPFKGGFK